MRVLRKFEAEISAVPGVLQLSRFSVVFLGSSFFRFLVSSPFFVCLRGLMGRINETSNDYRP